MTDKEIRALMEAWAKAQDGIDQHQLNQIMNHGHREN